MLGAKMINNRSRLTNSNLMYSDILKSAGGTSGVLTDFTEHKRHRDTFSVKAHRHPKNRLIVPDWMRVEDHVHAGLRRISS
jgi:hypothetical protein